MYKEKIFECISQNPDASLSTISKICGCSISNVLHSINLLKIEGRLIDVPPVKRWRLPDTQASA